MHELMTLEVCITCVGRVCTTDLVAGLNKHTIACHYFSPHDAWMAIFHGACCDHDTTENQSKQLSMVMFGASGDVFSVAVSIAYS